MRTAADTDKDIDSDSVAPVCRVARTRLKAIHKKMSS